MARINIEESIYKDARFFELVAKVGGLDTAIGCLVRAWIVAQPYWVANQRGIPKPEWKKQKLRDELIEVGFARDDGDFYYVAGSKQQFDWLIRAKESGRRGGLKSQGKISRDPRGGLKGLQPSSSSSSSLVLKTPPTPPNRTWSEIKTELLAKFPGDADRLEGAVNQIRREGKHGTTEVRYPVGFVAKMWGKIRQDYAHHDKPKLKVVKEESFDQEKADRAMKEAMEKFRSIKNPKTTPGNESFAGASELPEVDEG